MSALAKYLAKMGGGAEEALLSKLAAAKGMAGNAGEALGPGGSALAGLGAGAGGMAGLEALLGGEPEEDPTDDALAMRHRQRRGGI